MNYDVSPGDDLMLSGQPVLDLITLYYGTVFKQTTGAQLILKSFN